VALNVIVNVYQTSDKDGKFYKEILLIIFVKIIITSSTHYFLSSLHDLSASSYLT
jgi:hypothetical protein